MNQYEDIANSPVNKTHNATIKFLELVFIFAIIFSVVCRVTNNNYVHKLLSKVYNIVLSKLGAEEGLISYVDEMNFYGIRTNQVNIVISSNLQNKKLPANHISNISPTNNIPISTPNLKLDENGNIIPDDTFLKSNPFLIPSNANKKTEVKENPIQFPTIIVTLPNEAILPYSPKIPMDIYYREGWVDYSNPENTNAYVPKDMHKQKTYDFNYLAPLIPKNHSSLKLQQSFMIKAQQRQIEAKTNIPTTEDVTPTKDTSVVPEVSVPVTLNINDSNLIGNYYLNDNVNEYAEEYELVNHAFWWQEDNHQQVIVV